MRWLILLLTLLMSCEKEAPKQTIRPVKTIQVSQVPSADNQVIFPGTLRAFKRADLSFRVDGIVIIRDITVGQKAKKDEVLLQLDPREYELSLAKAKGKVESIQAELAFAGRDYERMKKIYDRDPGAISVNLLDRRDESNNRLKAELAIAQSDLSKALDDLSYTTLKAPFEGIIAAIYVENHEQVRAKQAVVRFIDTSEREMEINVPEKLINSFLEGWSDLRFNVYLDAFPGKMFSASIKEIGTEASAATQTYPVTLTLEAVPLELSLLAGMSGKAILQQSQKHGDNIFTVPKSAIFTENLNETYVWVVDPSTQMVHKKSVKLMKNATGNQAQVQEGINEGEWVVIAGTSFLSEGQKVKLAAEQSKE